MEIVIDGTRTEVRDDSLVALLIRAAEGQEVGDQIVAACRKQKQAINGLMIAGTAVSRAPK